MTDGPPGPDRSERVVPSGRVAPAPPSRVAVILVTWNNFSDTAECLASIRHLEHPDVLPIVVDNGSTDGSIPLLREQFPGLTILENRANLGLAAANNVGIRHALEQGARFGLLLNNDTVVDPGLIAAFLAAAADAPEAAIFGAKVLRYDDPRRIWLARPRWDSARAGFVHEGSGFVDDGVCCSETAEISYAVGCALFFRAELVREIGLLDERYFLYFEEIDWCFRARAAGRRCVFVPGARVWHKVGRSAGAQSPMSVYFEIRNQLFWSARHLAGRERRAYRRNVLLPLFWALRNARGQPLVKRLRADVAWLAAPGGRAFLRGIADHVRGRYGDCPPHLRPAQRATAPAVVRKADDPLRGMFCSRPFEWLEIQGRTATPCCPGWIRIPGADIRGASVAAVWNGPQAQSLRAAVLDGSFRLCIRSECPYISQPGCRSWEKGGPPLQLRDRVADPRLQRIIARSLTVLDDGPVTLNAGWDRSCNLHCRSCRPEPFALGDAELAREEAFQNRILGEVGEGLRTLYLSGTGDPFASRSYRRLLRELPFRRLHRLEVHLGTNGLLWTQDVWESLGGGQHKVTSAHISVDAATAPTYALNRRGGSWETLRRNLGFVAELRRDGLLRFVLLSFVVQAENFREMPAFVEMVGSYGFDLALFQKLCNWGIYSAAEYRDRAVHEPEHPDHPEFLQLLRDEIFARPTVGLACLHPQRERARRA